MFHSVHCNYFKLLRLRFKIKKIIFTILKTQKFTFCPPIFQAAEAEF